MKRKKKDKTEVGDILEITLENTDNPKYRTKDEAYFQYGFYVKEGTKAVYKHFDMMNPNPYVISFCNGKIWRFCSPEEFERFFKKVK